MLKDQEELARLRYERLCGERHYGQFDFDASSSTGPSKRPVQGGSAAPTAGAASGAAIEYEVVVDPRTGEPRYRAKPTAAAPAAPPTGT